MQRERQLFHISWMAVPQSSDLFTPVSSGTHSIQVQAAGCLVSPAEHVTLTTPTGPGACGASFVTTALPDVTGCGGTVQVTANLGPSAIYEVCNCPSAAPDCKPCTQTPEGCSTEGSSESGCAMVNGCNDPLGCPFGPEASGKVSADVTYVSTSLPLISGFTPTTTLDIKKCISGKKIKPGKDATFKIVVTNTGNTAANNLKVTDILPSNVEFVAGKSCDAWTFTADGQTITALLDSLAAGASSTIKLIVRVPKTVTNEATVQADAVAPVTATACARIA